MMEYIISEASFDKLKVMALEIHNLKLVYRNYYEGDGSWWVNGRYTDKQGNTYTPHKIFELRGRKLKQYMNLIESCLYSDGKPKPYTDELKFRINELDRIMSHGK